MRTLSQAVVASLMEPDGCPTVNMIASILLSQRAFDCSADFNSEARAKSDFFHPIFFITTSIVPR